MNFGAISDAIFCKFNNRVAQIIVENRTGPKSEIIVNRL